MALPIQNAAVYTAIVPSTKQEIKFRAFLVKEEKALLIAQRNLAGRRTNQLSAKPGRDRRRRLR